MRTTSTGKALLFLGGPLIWAAYFFGMYAAETLFCLSPATQAGASFLPYAVVGTALAVLALLGFMGWQLLRVRQRILTGEHGLQFFLHAGAMMLATASLLAVAWGALPAFFLPVCAGMGS